MDAEKQYGLVDTLHRVFGKNIRVNVGFSKSACDSSIEELALSVRSYNALHRANITILGDLIERLNEGGLKSIRNLGAKSFTEIQTKMVTVRWNLGYHNYRFNNYILLFLMQSKNNNPGSLIKLPRFVLTVQREPLY